MIRRPTFSSRFVVTALGLAAACSTPRAEDTTPSARVIGDSVVLDSAQRASIVASPVAIRDFVPLIVTTGTVTFNGDASAQVTSPMSGPVTAILADLGATVRRGEVLAQVASPDFAAAVADYRKAITGWRNARRIADLDEQLFANDAISRSERDQARSDLAAAVADRDAATASLRGMGLDSAVIASLIAEGAKEAPQAAIRSPLPGTVVERLITPGQMVEAGATPAFTIADLSTVWVLANVFEGDIGGLTEGAVATIRSPDGGDSLVGRVTRVGAVVDPASKAAAVRLVVPNRGGRLRPNMLVEVTLHANRKRQGILAPVTAVLRDDDNLPFVFLRIGSGRFLRRRIALGPRIGDAYQVSQGLAVGDTLVTAGSLYLAEAIGR